MTNPSDLDAQHVGTLWMLDLTSSTFPATCTPLLPATFLRAGSEVADELAPLMEFISSAPVLQRFALGKQCAIARVEGQLVTSGWITFDREEIGSLGLNVHPQLGEAYI